MANPWFVEIPADAVGKPDSYLEQVDFRTNAWAVGSPQYNALVAGQPISDFGMQVVRWKGPFATEAEAQAAQNPQPSPSGPQALGNAASSAIGNALGIPHFTSSAWRGYAVRALKIIAGVVLIIIGTLKLTNAPQKALQIAEARIP